MKKKLPRVFLVILLLVATGLTLAFYLLCYRPMRALERVAPPEGAQVLQLPLRGSLIAAGYRNPYYLQSKGYPHYGVDVTTVLGRHADALAAGDGVVLGTEQCDNSLGFIAVIRHDNVFLPGTGETISLIGRYYHMTSLQIGEGDAVSAGEVIGSIDRYHKWYNHVHLELDTDLAYPFHTPQVAEASSELLHRYPADGESFIEPLSALAAGRGQWYFANPFTPYCTEKDQLRYAVQP